MTRQLVIHFNQFPWPLASGIELAATLAESATDTRFVFAGHAVPERGLFLPVPRALARIPGISMPEPQSMRAANLTLVSLPTYRRTNVRPLELQGWREFTRSQSWETLQAVTVDGLPGGKAVANYIVRRAGTRQLDLDRVTQRVRFLLFAYREASVLVEKLLRDSQANEVYAYQGNWLNDRAVVDVARVLGVACSTYGEVAPGKYWQWNEDPYRLSSWQRLDVPRMWTEATEGLSQEAKISLVRDVINEFASPDNNPFSTLGQATYSGPSGRGYVAFFTANSSDERFGLDPEWEPKWPDQLQFALQLWSNLRSNGLELAIRVHPNTARKPLCEQQPWIDLERRARKGAFPGLTVVPAASLADSYALAASSHAAVTWGSNIALELVARGIKTVNVAPANYDAVGAVPLATSMVELMALLNSPSEQPLEQERAAAWLWFMREEWPVAFRHVQVDEGEDGVARPTFQGHPLGVDAIPLRLSRPWSRFRASSLLSGLMSRRYRAVL